MDSPSLPMDVRDINVCLLSAKKKSSSSPSLRELDQMSLSGNLSSSVSFAEELSKLGDRPMSSGRKRKRTAELDYDTQSVQDFTFREPSAKKFRRPLSKVTSLANKIRESPLMQAKKTLKRSLSFSKEPPPSSKYRLPSTPKGSRSYPLRRSSSKSKLAKPHLPSTWAEEMGPEEMADYSREEIKRQEAIYSVFKTECEMVEDLKMIVNIFFHPLLRLNLISEEEHCKIFGNIQTILSIHEDLVSKFEELRSRGECVQAVGKMLLDWSVTLSPYAQYCANLVTAKLVLENKKQDPAFDDFLQRCLDSEFSRKIELWTFLDSPRSRIMKYPILIKEVKKKTPSNHEDHEYLDEALSSFDSVLKDIDRCTGIAKCRSVISRLEYIHDDQRCEAIDESQFIICSGVLRNKNNSKLHAFLFDKILVLTRPSSRTGTLLYQVYRQPIPLSSLIVEDVIDGEARLAGSFRGTRTLKNTSNTGCRFLFKVSSSDPQVTRHAHTLQANGDYDKKAWLDAFKTVVPVHCSVSPSVTTV